MSNIAERVSFWTPVLGNGWFLDGIEGLFSGNACPCDGTDSEVVVIDPDTSIARVDGKSSSWEGCILKIVFFITFLLPLIALIIKGIYRSQVTITFEATPTEAFPQEEAPSPSPPLTLAPNDQDSFKHLVDIVNFLNLPPPRLHLKEDEIGEFRNGCQNLLRELKEKIDAGQLIPEDVLALVTQVPLVGIECKPMVGIPRPLIQALGVIQCLTYAAGTPAERETVNKSAQALNILFTGAKNQHNQMVMRVENRLNDLFTTLRVDIIPGLFGAYPNHRFIKITQYQEADGLKWTFSDGIFNLHLRAKDVEGAFISIELDRSAERVDGQVIASILNHLMIVKSNLQSVFIPGEMGTTILSDFCDLVNRPNAPTLPRCGREKQSAPKMVNHSAAIAALLILGNTPIDSASDSALMSLCGPTPQNSPYTPEQVYLAKTLIHKGANLNVSMNRTTPIQAAIARGSKELVELCLASGRLLPDAQGKTPFHHALFPKPNHEILTLLTTKAPQWIDTADQEETTPLQLAIMNRDREGATLLIKAGAAIDPTIAPLIQATITRAKRV